MFNVYKNQLSRQTGSRNLTGPKMLPTIWYTYMTLVTKYQISAISNQLILNSVLQFCVGILMLCMNCFLNKRNCRYYEKKVQNIMVNNATNINKRVFVPVPSQYLYLQRYMPWSLLWSVILRSEVIACFVDIDEIADHHGLNLHFITISHIESLNIKRIIDQTYSCFASYNMGN